MAFEVRYDGGMAAPGAAMSYKAGKGMFDQWLAGMQMQRDRMAQSDQQLMARGMMDSLGRQQQFSQEQQLLQMRDKLGKDAFDYEITAKQKQKWDSLNAELDWIDEQKDWDADQKAYARDAVRSQMIGLGQKRIVPKKDTTPIAEQFKARSYVDEYGTTWMLQPDKTFKPQMAPKETGTGASNEDEMKKQVAAGKRINELMRLTKGDIDKSPMYSYEQAQKLAYKEFGIDLPPAPPAMTQQQWMEEYLGEFPQKYSDAARQGIQQAVEQTQAPQQQEPPATEGVIKERRRRGKFLIGNINAKKLKGKHKDYYDRAVRALESGQETAEALEILQIILDTQ